FYSGLAEDAWFNAIILGMADRYLRARGGVLLGAPAQPARRRVPLEEAVEVAVRFFFPDAVTPAGIQSHVCVEINGLRDFEGGRDIILEAFAYSAIFRDLLHPRFGVMEDYREARR